MHRIDETCHILDEGAMSDRIAKQILDNLAQYAGFAGCSVINAERCEDGGRPMWIWYLELNTAQWRSAYPVASKRGYISIFSNREDRFAGCIFTSLLGKCIKEAIDGFDLWCGIPPDSEIDCTGLKFCTCEQLMIMCNLYGLQIKKEKRKTKKKGINNDI